MAMSDETKEELLRLITQGNPYVLVEAVDTPAEDLGVTLQVGGGITNMQDVQALLSKTLGAVSK